MDVVRQIESAALVVGLLVGLLAVGRKRGWVQLPRVSAGPGRRIEILERTALGVNHGLHLVRWGDRHLLIATSPGACQVIDSQSARAAASGASGGPS